MKQKIKVTVLLVFAAGSAFFFTRAGQMQTEQKTVKTAAEVYKNIKVLKDMPADQLDSVMEIMSASLGVKCNFCHIPEQWESDAKEEKQTAREMITMTFAINKNNFNGRTEVSCATCHNGKPHPNSQPALGQNLFQRPNFGGGTKETLPTIDAILDKYMQALGGKEAVEKVKTRTIKATRTQNDGQPFAEEVFEKMPDKMLVVSNVPQMPFSTGYNGADVWTNGGKAEYTVTDFLLEQFKDEAQFNPLKLKESYAQIAVSGSDKINDKDVWAIRAATASGERERLYFDKKTGLLVRRVSYSPTVLGFFAYQVDYDDYRAVDGVKIPYLVKWSIPGRSWTRKTTEVKQNTAIDDAKFNQPTK